MANRVLVLTTEPLPLPGQSTTGAGLRAVGLAEGLRARGLHVTIGTPSVPSESPSQSRGVFDNVRLFRRQEIAQLIQSEQPDVVVLQHWGLAREVPELSVPLALDLAGPHLLERMYWGNSDYNADLLEKLAAIRRADFICCSGEYQRHYFYPLLAMAGFDVRKHHVPVIPFSVPAKGWEDKAYGSAQVTSLPRQQHSIVYGGAFLAWQDPASALTNTAEAIAAHRKGQLHFYGGSHPVMDASGGAFAELTKDLSANPNIKMHGFKPFDQLLQEYRSYDFALDLMARNPERELAYTTRTMIYLYCGLPVIYNGYSELSHLIRTRNCGWICDSTDELRPLLTRIFNGEERIEEKRANALAVANEISWDKTITPLAEFCANPHTRPEKIRFVLTYESRERELQVARRDRDASVSRLQQLEGKLIFRVYRKLTSSGTWLAPFIWAASWPASFYIWLRLRASSTRE